jgi:hypothetical protein
MYIGMLVTCSSNTVHAKVQGAQGAFSKIKISTHQLDEMRIPDLIFRGQLRWPLRSASKNVFLIPCCRQLCQLCQHLRKTSFWSLVADVDVNICEKKYFKSLLLILMPTFAKNSKKSLLSMFSTKYFKSLLLILMPTFAKKLEKSPCFRCFQQSILSPCCWFWCQHLRKNSKKSLLLILISTFAKKLEKVLVVDVVNICKKLELNSIWNENRSISVFRSIRLAKLGAAAFQFDPSDFNCGATPD